MRQQERNEVNQLLDKQFDDLHQQRFWEKHIPQLSVKTIKKKVILGDIFPEHLTAINMKEKIKEIENKCPKSVQSTVKQFSEGENGYIEIEGNQAKIIKAQNVYIYGTEVAECEPHVQRPYIYPTRIEEKKSRAQKLQEAQDQLIKEFNEMEWKSQIKYGVRQDFLQRNYNCFMEAKPKKEKFIQKEKFWNSSNNVQKSFQDTSKKIKPKDPQKYTTNLINNLKQMPFKERELFYQKGFNQREYVHYFFKNIKKVLKYNQFDKKIYESMETQSHEQSSLRSFINGFCEINKLQKDQILDEQLIKTKEFSDYINKLGFDTQRRDIKKVFEKLSIDKPIYKFHQHYSENEQVSIRSLFVGYQKFKQWDEKYLSKHLLVDLQDFQGFILSLGYDRQRIDDIDEFFYQIYDESAFEDILINQDTIIQTFINPKQLKRKKQLISMKSFFWNFERFLKQRIIVEQKFSHLKCKQISINIRDHLLPWKKNFKTLQSNLNKLKESEQLVLDVVNSINVNLADQINILIEQRKEKIKLKRAIANNLYRPLKQKLVNFDELKKNFIKKILIISSEISIFEFFADGFRKHKEQLYQTNQDDENLTSFNLCDIAEYIRTQDYTEEEVNILITYIKKVFSFVNKDLNQRIQIKDLRNFIQTFSQKKENSYLNYKNFLNDLHHKIEKLQNVYDKEKKEKILNNEIRLYEANRKPIKQNIREYSTQKVERNLLSQALIKYITKLNKQILRQFFIISSLIKLIQDHQFVEKLEEQQLINKIKAILNITSIPPEFTNKFLFSETLLVVAKKYCADIQEKAKLENWDQELEKALQIFHVQAENLTQVLYQWKYLDQEGNEYQDPEEIKPEQDEGKVINVLDQIHGKLNKYNSTTDQFRDKYNAYVSPEKRKQNKQKNDKNNNIEKSHQKSKIEEIQKQINLEADSSQILDKKQPSQINQNPIQLNIPSFSSLIKKSQQQQQQSEIKLDLSQRKVEFTPLNALLQGPTLQSKTFNEFSDKVSQIRKSKAQFSLQNVGEKSSITPINLGQLLSIRQTESKIVDNGTDEGGDIQTQIDKQLQQKTIIQQNSQIQLNNIQQKQIQYQQQQLSSNHKFNEKFLQKENISDCQKNEMSLSDSNISNGSSCYQPQNQFKLTVEKPQNNQVAINNFEKELMLKKYGGYLNSKNNNEINEDRQLRQKYFPNNKIQ